MTFTIEKIKITTRRWLLRTVLTMMSLMVVAFPAIAIDPAIDIESMTDELFSSFKTDWADKALHINSAIAHESSIGTYITQLNEPYQLDLVSLCLDENYISEFNDII